MLQEKVIQQNINKFLLPINFIFSQATTKQTPQVESFRSLGASGILILIDYIQRKLFFL